MREKNFSGKLYRIGKRAVAAMLSVLLLLSGIDTTAWADTTGSGYTVADKGTIENTNISWQITSDGTLTISGSGAMPNYDSSTYSSAPWYKYRSPSANGNTKQIGITKVVIEDGITSVGDYAFGTPSNVTGDNYNRLTSIELSDTVTSIGDYAFASFHTSAYFHRLVLPKSFEHVTSIGDYAFYGAKSLADDSTSIILLNIKKIGNTAFYFYGATTGYTVYFTNQVNSGNGIKQNTTVVNYSYLRRIYLQFDVNNVHSIKDENGNVIGTETDGAALINNDSPQLVDTIFSVTPASTTASKYAFEGWKLSGFKGNFGTSYYADSKEKLLNGQSTKIVIDGESSYYHCPGTWYQLNLAEDQDWKVTFTAGWMDAVTVRFDGNGADGGEKMTAQAFRVNGPAVPLQKNTYTKTGYSFLGWSTTDTATAADFTDEEAISESDLRKYAMNSEVTFYAVWQKNQFTVTDPGAQDWTYDGTDHKDQITSFEVSGTRIPAGTTGRVSESLVENRDYIVTWENSVNASAKDGDATVTISGKPGGNYAAATPIIFSFAIKQKEVTVAWDDANTWEYDGTLHVPTATVKGLIAADAKKCSVIVDGGKTDAGENYVASVNSVGEAVTLPGGTAIETDLNYSIQNLAELPTKLFTITPRTVSLSWYKNEDKDSLPFQYDYDGVSHEPVVVVGNLVGGDVCTVSTRVLERMVATAPEEEVASSINAATYRKTITALSNSNYVLPADPYQEYLINPIDMEVSAPDVNAVYDGEDHSISVNVTNKKQDSDIFSITYRDGDTGDYSAENPTQKDVGSKTVYYKITSGNYNPYPGEDEERSASVTVTRKPVTITWNVPSAENLVYDGTEKTVTVDIIGLMEEDTGSGKVLTTISGVSGTNARDYTAMVTLSGAAASNYEIVSGASQAWSITKAVYPAPPAAAIGDDEVTVLVDTSSYSYDKKPASVEYALDDATTYIPLVSGTTSFSPEGLQSGTHTIHLRRAADANHYASADADTTWTVYDIYTITYHAGSGTGGSTPGPSQSRNKNVTVASCPDAFAKTGYHFTGWNTAEDGSGKAYAAGATLNYLADGFSDKDEITLYAQWSANEYQVVFHDDAEGQASGNTRVQDFMYAVWQALIPNPFRKLGYHFGHWMRPGSDITYTDEELVQNLTAVQNGTVSFFLIWEGNEYTVIYNGNHATGGTMENSSLTYDAPETLRVNEYERTGYDFSGWATSENGVVKYTDAQSVSNLATEEEATVTLYAVWTPHQYTITYMSNDGTGGEKTQTFDYHDAHGVGGEALEPNTFTRTGYGFVGWNTSADGSGTPYVDGAEISAGVQDLTLYAQWEAGNYTVVFDSNDERHLTDTLADVRYDEGIELPADSFAKTGAHYATWNTAPDGSGTSYAAGTTESGLVPSGTVTLYAQWESNTYTVSFQPGSGSGTMANQTFTYGVEQALTENSFVAPTGYHFDGWVNNAGIAYGNKATVSNLTSVQGGVVTLTAQWAPNNYTVHFDKNAEGASGTMPSQSFTYDVQKALSANGFTPPSGYGFAGWATESAGPVVYTNGQSVTNLSTVQNGNVTLYAKWQGEPYQICFDRNGATAGSMRNEAMNVGVEKALTVNAYTRTGYTFVSWNTAADGSGTDYTDQEVVKNLTTTKNEVVTLYAQWREHIYTVHFHKNKADATRTMEDESFLYTEEKALTENAYLATGYTFLGWAESENGTVKYKDKKVVSKLSTKDNGEINLYAVWEANTYQVVFDKNHADATGTMTPQSLTYGVSRELNSNQFQPPLGSHFTGWNTASDGSGIGYADRASVSNLTAVSGGVVTLYAQWAKNTYTVLYKPNGGSEAEYTQSFTYDTPAKLSANAFNRTGYTFRGWSTTLSGAVDYTDQQSVLNLTDADQGIVTLYAVWEANRYFVSYHANGGSGVMEDQTFTYNVPQALTANSFTNGDKIFVGWVLSAGESRPQYTDGQTVSNLAAVSGATVDFYAVWKESYNVQFDPNGADTGTIETLAYPYDIDNSLPGKPRNWEKRGYTFLGWAKSKNGAVISSVQQEKDGNQKDPLLLYAIWVEDNSDVAGNVTGDAEERVTISVTQGNTTLKTVEVELKQEGGECVARYSFSDLNPGYYNIVATEENGTTTVTILTKITSGGVDSCDIKVPSGGKSSIVYSTSVLVGDLDTLANINQKSYTLTVTRGAADESIAEMAGSRTVEYYDITIKDGAGADVHETTSPLRIVIPFNASGKNNIAVYRDHEGVVTALLEGEDYSAENGYIVIYANRFSTYAVGYTVSATPIPVPIPGAGGGEGTDSGSDTGTDTGASGGSDQSVAAQILAALLQMQAGTGKNSGKNGKESALKDQSDDERAADGRETDAEDTLGTRDADTGADGTDAMEENSAVADGADTGGVPGDEAQMTTADDDVQSFNVNGNGLGVIRDDESAASRVRRVLRKVVLPIFGVTTALVLGFLLFLILFGRRRRKENEKK